MDFLEQCKKIIQIDSTPTSGNEDVALFCAELAREAGLDVTLQETSLNGLKQFNLIARPQNSSRQDEVIFQTHLDTVEPGPMGNWTKTDSNPFQATVVDDRIYGLGVADVKLDFLCKLRALKAFANTKQTRPFVLVGTFAEEIGMHGAQYLMQTKAVDARMAIIGEPSELQIVYANNGYMVLDFEIPYSVEELHYKNEHEEKNFSTQEKVFHGKAVHSSTPHLGDNAIHKLIDYLEKMPTGIAVVKARGGSSVNTVPADAFVEVDASKTFENAVSVSFLKLARKLQGLDREFLNFEDQTFSPAHPTLNIGLLDTRKDHLWLSISIRVTPNIDQEQLDTWVTRMKKEAESLGGVCNPQRLSPAALTSLSSELVTGAIEIAKKLGLSEKPITKASGTECSIYRKFGIDCIVIGPGVSIGNSHTANEYNFLPQLEKATEFYTEAVKRFCL
jgi:acetylornithine deacetylase/succinyl-diaminopimelate desuccinylase-like protein